MLPWISRISYGAVTFDLSLPQRPWTPISVGVGGYEESAAGVPSVWEYRRDEQRRIRIRFTEAEWPEVHAWLVYAQRSGQFGMAPDRSGTSYTCYLVSPRMGEPIEPQPGDSAGVWEIELVIRTVSGAVIPGRYYGLEPLIVYEPGQRPSILHSSRTSPAYERGQDGVYREVAAGVLRDGHWRRDASGLLVPATLLEPGATNLIPNSSNFGTGMGWGGSSEWTVTPAASILQGQVASHHRNLSTGIDRNRWRDIGTYTGQPETLYIIIENESGATTDIRLQNPVTSATIVRARLTWATGEVFIVAGAGTPFARYLGTGPNGGPAYLFGITVTAEVGLVRRLYVHPTGQTQNSASAILHHVQLETGSTATSPTVTGAEAAPRSPDSLYLDLPPEVRRPGSALAIYSRWVHDMDGDGGISSPGIWGISSAAYATPRIAHYLVGNQMGVVHHNGATDTRALLSRRPVTGDLVETLTLLWTNDGGSLVGRLMASVAGGPLAAANLPPLAPAAAWSAPRLYIGSRGTAPGVYGYERLAVAAGRIRGSDVEMMSQARTWRMGVR